jgi:Flp pilus assembly protein TadD
VAQDLQAALEHHGAGRLQEAADLYREALRAEPANSDALHLLGVAELQLGRHESAIGLIEKAIGLDPAQAAFHNNLGEAHRALGRIADAERCYRAALALDADFAAAHGNLGNALLAQERHREAAKSFRRAVALEPGNAQFHHNLAVVLHALGRPHEAEESARLALALRPEMAEAHCLLAIALVELGRLQEAEQSCREAIALRPGFAEPHNILGNALREQGRLQEAERSCREAIALKPGFAEAYNHLAVTLFALGRMDEAEQSYREAIALKPDYTDAHVNLSQLCLLRGRFAEGWQEYGWRWRRNDMARPDTAGHRLWRGDEDIAGKTMLLIAEQGLGDTIHFARYAKLVAAKGATVIVEVPKVLAPLLAGTPGLGRVIAEGGKPPPNDFHCPLISLPHAFQTRLEDIPPPLDHLQAVQGAAAEWRAQLGGRGEKLVGLAWRGSPVYKGDRFRSIRLAALEALLQLPGIRFVSLQKELRDDERAIAERARSFVHPGRDFKSTAQLIAALDLVVSVDTVWAHWAGSIGKPVWLMISHPPHWCWMLGRDDSPWYPSARLFRQPQSGDWATVIGNVGSELARFRG